MFFPKLFLSGGLGTVTSSSKKTPSKANVKCFYSCSIFPLTSGEHALDPSTPPEAFWYPLKLGCPWLVHCR